MDQFSLLNSSDRATCQSPYNLLSVNRYRKLSVENEFRVGHRPQAGIVEAYPAVVTRPRFWTASKQRFDTSPVVPLRSSSCLSPDPVNSEPFPSAFTTLVFGQSRRRWFGTCSCKPVPRGRPSSVKQLRISSAFRPFAVLVAHYRTALSEK